MSQNIEIVKSLNKACTNKDFDAAAKLLHPDFTFKDPKMSFKSAKEYLDFMKVCPFTGSPENIVFIESGDKIVQIFDCMMTEPIAFSFRICDTLTLKDGKIIAEEVFYDTAQIPKDAVDIAEAALEGYKPEAA